MNDRKLELVESEGRMAFIQTGLLNAAITVGNSLQRTIVGPVKEVR